MSKPITKEQEREKLPMEVKFDKRVYGGISYFAQALAGSGLTYWIKHAGGRSLYDKLANWAGPNFISKISKKTGKDAIAAADYWITVSTMVFVGSLFVIPVKWLEDMKNGIVEKWTKQDNARREAAGEIITPEEKAHQEKLLNQLKAEPKQDWWSLGMGRLVSLIPVYTALPLLGGFNKVMEHGFQNFMKKAVSFVGAKKIGESEALKNASGIAFYDGFYSIISAGGLYVYSHFVAPPKKQASVTGADIIDIAAQALAESKTIEHKPHTAHITKKPKSYVENIVNADQSANKQLAL